VTRREDIDNRQKGDEYKKNRFFLIFDLAPLSSRNVEPATNSDVDAFRIPRGIEAAQSVVMPIGLVPDVQIHRDSFYICGSSLLSHYKMYTNFFPLQNGAERLHGGIACMVSWNDRRFGAGA